MGEANQSSAKLSSGHFRIGMRGAHRSPVWSLSLSRYFRFTSLATSDSMVRAAHSMGLAAKPEMSEMSILGVACFDSGSAP